MLEVVVMKLENTYSFWSNSDYHIFMKNMNGESDERGFFFYSVIKEFWKYSNKRFSFIIKQINSNEGMEYFR